MINFFKIIIFILLFIIQISFISALPAPFFNINLIIIGLAILLILTNLEDTLGWGFLAGVLLDMHSFYFFGLNIISLLVALVLANLLATKFFTNRSIYSYISLATITLICFEFIRSFLIFLFNFFTKGTYTYQEIFSFNYFLSLGYKLLFGIIIIFISFYSINYYSKKMKTFFITSKR